MSVFKKYRGKRITPRDKNWHKGTWYVWKRVGGKIIHKAIKEARTKEQAELAERKLIEQAFNSKYGVAGRTDFQTFANGSYARYVQQHNVNRGAKTLYIAHLCKYFATRTLDEITPQDCRDAQHYFRKTQSDSSVNRIMSTLSKLFTVACQEGILDRNPMQYVVMLKEPEPRKRVLTIEEKERLWKELDKDSLLQRLVILAVNLPLRKGQLLAITPDVIDFQNGVLFAIASKGRKSRPIPLNSTVQATLSQMIEDGQLPFPLKDFRRRWVPMLVKAGINKKDGKRGENFTFHDLRHQLASEMINRHNINPEIVRQAFGHSDMSITQVYMNADFDTLRTALNKLDATESQHEDENGGFIN